MHKPWRARVHPPPARGRNEEGVVKIDRAPSVRGVRTQAAAHFAGGGDNAFERLRRSLGVDSLDIGMSVSGSPTVGVSRAISDRLSVGVKAGSKPEDSGVSVDYDVTRHIRVQSGIDAKGGSSLGVGAEWEYK
jgi:translocation and assembly module TamB